MKTTINLIICSITLSVISFFSYHGIIRQSVIIDLKTHCSILQLFAIFLLFIVYLSLFIVLSYIYIFKQLRSNKKHNEFNYVVKFLFWYEKSNIFYKIYTTIFYYCNPHYTQYLVILTKHFLNLSRKKKNYLIYIFVVLPRALIITIMLLEVYNQKLHYYPYSLFLLLIPTIFKFFVFVLKDIGPRLLPEIGELLHFDHSNNNTYTINTANGQKKLKAIGIRFKPEHADADLDHYMYNYYYPMLYIGGEMDANFLPKYSKTTLIILLIYFGIHMFGWGYLLWLILI